ncbi:MAG: glycosyltransferase family 2 protein [Clostridia bacterium]|nr:glycosyltransferase family 2 protein [Clostridia bacterium]
MVKPKVSIIVPIYKTEKYLMRCIKTLVNQTLSEIEIILVDDGSPDNCPALCDELSKKDDRIKVVHKENAGLGMARNSGIEAATGEYIGFIDSDDYVDLKMFEELYDAIVRHDAELVMSGVSFVGGNMFGNDGECSTKSYFLTEQVFEGEDDIKNLMLGISGALPHESDDSRYGMSVWKNLFKREVIEKNSLRFQSEREILSEDALFMVDYIHCIKKAVGVPGAYYSYCRNEDSLSKSYKKDRFEKSLIFMEELEKRLKRDIPQNEYKIYLDRLAQAFGRILCSQEIVHAQENKIKYRVLKRRLMEICTCEKISGVLKTYPWQKLPLKQAVFAFTMKYRLFYIQKLIVALRNR